jgi:hypothetical protein
MPNSDNKPTITSLMDIVTAFTAYVAIPASSPYPVGFLSLAADLPTLRHQEPNRLACDSRKRQTRVHEHPKIRLVSTTSSERS